MHKQYLKPNELDQQIKSLAGREREILSEVIQTIREIDRRKLYLEFGFANLFAYLTESVGYSAGSAQRRIDAARLANDVPELIQNIESGEIQLTQVSQIQKAIRQVKSSTNQKPTAEDKQAIVKQVLSLPEIQSQKQICEYFDLPVLQQQKEIIQKDDSFRIEVTLNREQYDNLKQAQALLSQTTDSQDLAVFINYVSQKIIQQKLGKKNLENAKCQMAVGRIKNDLKVSKFETDKSVLGFSKQFDQNNTVQVKCDELSSNKSNQLPIEKNNQELNLNHKQEQQVKTNLIKLTQKIHKPNYKCHMVVTNQFSLRTKKLVLSKQASCQFQDLKTGKICGSRWHLQVDHKQSRWAGGCALPENAQVLCANHNQLKYRKENFVVIN